MREKWQSRTVTVLMSLGLFFLITEITSNGALLGKFLSVISPLVYGSLVALILGVFMSLIMSGIEKIDKKNKLPEALKTIVSLITTVLIIALIFYLIIILLIPRFAEGIESIINTVNKNWDKIVEFCNNLGLDASRIKAILNELDTNKVLDFAGENVKTVLNTAIKTVTSLSGGVFTAIISTVCCIYILYGRRKLGNQLSNFLIAYFPEKTANFIIDTSKLFWSTFKNFLTRQCLEALILGALLTIAMLIFRVPFALIIGAITAVLALIPYVGAFVSCGIGAILILLTEPSKFIIFIILFLVIQQIEGNIIYPHIVGKSVGLPAIWTLLAVYAGGEILGIVGMFMFVPIASVIYTLVKRDVRLRIKAEGTNK
ncbi:MAG: AI-2E family transporter [Oscillospiraceae bacterium]|nr:AI-2E family transporter [Oscillospiraceae bacterium]